MLVHIALEEVVEAAIACDFELGSHAQAGAFGFGFLD
jgi:hypothetical protein